MNTLFFHFKSAPKKYLGRWKLDYCDQALLHKIRLANEDHCGVCDYTTASDHTKSTKVGENAEGIRRYNEYMHLATRGRKPSIVDRKSIDQKIEYYICMQ